MARRELAIEVKVSKVQEIAKLTASLKELRKESPTSLLKGKVINQLPTEGTKLSLLFEGHDYELQMRSGELVVNGLEENRIIAV